MTARTLIRRALMLIGVLAEGENPSAEALSDGILALNDLLGSWSSEGLLINTVVREEFPLVPGQASRTMGPSGNFNTTRPTLIERITIEIQSSNPTFERQVDLLTLDQWADIVTKDTAGIPTKVYVAGTNPLETLNFYPVPNTSDKVVIYSQKALLNITDGNTDIDLPPPYARALRTNLAIELAPEYGKSVSPELMTMAMESKGNVKRMNITEHHLLSDQALLQSGGFNITRGY